MTDKTASPEKQADFDNLIPQLKAVLVASKTSASFPKELIQPLIADVYRVAIRIGADTSEIDLMLQELNWSPDSKS